MNNEKEFRPNRMDVQTYNKVFLPQWTTASLFIRNLQLTLEGKCDKESLRQLQIIGWNEETKKFISDILNFYKEKVLDELNSISNNDYSTSNKDYFDKKIEKALKENTMENYIVINGKKAELTKEQLKQLGIEVEPERNNPFDRVAVGDSFYYRSRSDNILSSPDNRQTIDTMCFHNANYFNDESFANQVMLHQQLYRKLLRYAYDNNAEVTEDDWETDSKKYFIYYEYNRKDFLVDWLSHCNNGFDVYFKNSTVAKKAIEDIIKPFMKEHPEFVW